MFARSFRGRLDFSHDLAFPVIVKPAREDGSIGIEFNAVVNSIRELMERIDWLHANFNSPVLIEEYVEGREIYVGVIGNDNATALPPVELDLSKLPAGTPRIAGAEVKWGKGTGAYRDTKSAVAEDLPEETVALLQSTAVAVYQALELRDYARIDMRLRPDGRVAVIEANPNPWLASKAEFAMAARKAGRTYNQLIGEILDLALGTLRRLKMLVRTRRSPLGHPAATPCRRCGYAPPVTGSELSVKPTDAARKPAIRQNRPVYGLFRCFWEDG